MISTTFFSLVVILLALTAASLADDQTIDGRIYTSITGDPCVLLLDKSGAYGCRTTSKSGEVGILQAIENAKELSSFMLSPPQQRKVLVMPSQLMAVKDFFSGLSATQMVAGVILTESAVDAAWWSEIQQSGFSMAPKNPSQVDGAAKFDWNPRGQDLIHQMLPFPMWKLGATDSSLVRARALENRARDGYPFHAAEMTAYMHPEQGDTSLDCLRKETCKPVGGHSTWTSLSPIDQSKETILVQASIDGLNLFTLQTPAADSDMSGAVAVMAALDGLIKSKVNTSKWQRQPIFALFDAESWGGLGSKSFVRHIKDGADSVKALSLEKIFAILEAKQVGAQGGVLYVHSSKQNGNTPVPKAMLEVGAFFGVQPADATNPSLPPSSAQTFVAASPGLANKIAVLTDHAAAYDNTFYGSMFDDAANVDSSLVCKAANTLLRTVVQLGSPQEDSLTFNANCTLVAELLLCLTKTVNCTEAINILPAFSEGSVPEFPTHYPSVYFSSTFSLSQRFIHDWVYDRVATDIVNQACTNGDSAGCSEGYSCMRSRCVQSPFTSYHDATSANVRWVQGEVFSYWEVADPSSAEPLWAEANWTPIGLRIFEMGSPYTSIGFGVVAALVTILTLAAHVVLRRKFDDWFRIL